MFCFVVFLFLVAWVLVNRIYWQMPMKEGERPQEFKNFNQSRAVSWNWGSYIVMSSQTVQKRKWRQGGLSLDGCYVTSRNSEMKSRLYKLYLKFIFCRNLSLVEAGIAVLMAIAVGALGALVLTSNFYHDLWIFVFCFVVASCQYCLLKVHLKK